VQPPWHIIGRTARASRRIGPVSSTLDRMKTNSPAVVAIMVHVPNPVDGLAWYEKAFPDSKRRSAGRHDFEFLDLAEVRIEIVQSDEKVASGAAGTVVYWQVENLDATLDNLKALGASLYRGPMEIENGQRMCQVRDSWGNCIGLRGR